MADVLQLTDDGGVTLTFAKRGAPDAPTLAEAKRARVAYEGKLAACGTIFDSSQGYAIWFDLAPGKLVEGFYKGLCALRVGDEVTIALAAAPYGYGARADVPGIPPGSDLLFTVTVHEAELRSTEDPATRAETVAAAKEASTSEQRARGERQAEIDSRKAAAAARAAEMAAKRQGGGGKPGAGGKGKK